MYLNKLYMSAILVREINNYRMGIRGLIQIIKANQGGCSELTCIEGKLIVDGYSILHELYGRLQLEWASGGCYTDQHTAVVEYFQGLVNDGVSPIVVVDGGGAETYINDTIDRRNNDINDLPGELRKQHENSDTKEYNSHHLPLLARKLYITSLKQIDQVQVLVSEGKAHATIVKLANYYKCPVLTNNSNYCVSGITEGVILFRKFESAKECRIVKQTKIVNCLNLPDPDLIYAIVAIQGDNNGNSVEKLIHGGIKADIYEKCEGQTFNNEIYYIVHFLQHHNIATFSQFKEDITKIFRPINMRQKLINNCRNAEEIYKVPATVPQRSVEFFQENTELHFPSNIPVPTIIAQYRTGDYPVIIWDAIFTGKCALDADVGDPELSPIPSLGCSIRQIMYGLASPYMNRTTRRCIEEYYRSKYKKDGEKPWGYVPYKVESLWKYEHLSGNLIFELDDAKRKTEARRIMYEVLKIPEESFALLEGGDFCTPTLAILTTYFWMNPSFAVAERCCPSQQLLKSLVLNFFMSSELADKNNDVLYNTRLRTYHNLLEWQSLYMDICGLNSMLLHPFPEIPPTNVLDSEFVLGLALSPNMDTINAFRDELTQEKLECYDQVMQMIVNN